MDLFEYQAKDLFAEYGVPVQPGKVAHTAAEARDIAAEFASGGHPLVVVKAQVKTGGRGKAGGVKLANGPDEAYDKASKILGMDIKGHTVHTVLIAQAVDIAAEYYLSFLLDRANRTFLAICTVQGGMEIEEVAHSSPDAVARIPVSPLTGVDAAKAAEIIAAGRIPEQAAEGAALLAERLWAMFADEDATLVEVNPLALTEDGAVLAVDGKVTLDENAAFRQQHAQFNDTSSTDPIETRAREKHLNYVKLEGEVGIIGNGAGLVMSTLDVVALAGQPFGGIKRPTSSTSAAGRPPRSWPTAWRSCCRTRACAASWSTSSAGSPPATRWPTASSRPSACWPNAGTTWTARSWSGWTAITPPRAGVSSTKRRSA